MILIPAIDIKSGRCVRLRQGDFLDETVFSNDPLAIAKQWIDQGAERLHIVDLDGAVNGKPVNKSTINAIAKQFPEVPIQVGGGIRDEQTIESYLGIGIEFVIVGTIAVNEPQFVKNLCQKYEGHMMVGLDARDGKIAIDGWSAFSNHDVIDFAKEFDGSGVAGIVYTDIARDGMLSGTNVEATADRVNKLLFKPSGKNPISSCQSGMSPSIFFSRSIASSTEYKRVAIMLNVDTSPRTLTCP